MRFFQLLEQSPDWRACRSDWQHRMLNDFACVEPWLQPTGQIAAVIQHLEKCEGPWDVAQYSDGTIEIIHQTTREPGPAIEREDAELLTIDPSIFMGVMQRALDLDPIAHEALHWPGVTPLGLTRSAKPAARRQVLLFTGYSSSHIERLASAHVPKLSNGSIYLVPSSSAISNSLDASIQRGGGRLTSIDCVLVMTETGIEFNAAWTDLLRSLTTKRHAPTTAPPTNRRRRGYPVALVKSIEQFLRGHIQQQVFALDDAQLAKKNFRLPRLTQAAVAEKVKKKPSVICRLFKRPQGAELKKLFQQANDSECISKLVEAEHARDLRAKRAAKDRDS